MLVMPDVSLDDLLPPGAQQLLAGELSQSLDAGSWRAYALARLPEVRCHVVWYMYCVLPCTL